MNTKISHKIQKRYICSILIYDDVMAGLGPSIKPILRDTFIELFKEVVNKLKHKNKDIDDIFDDIPESDEDIIED